jgi:HEAT repeat protein
MLLGALGGGVGVDALLSLLDDAVDDVRAAAAWALGQLSHWPAAGGLAAHMRDPAWEVRRNAALALRRLGSPGIVLLRRALDSDDRYAADMAQQILDLPDTADEAVLA